LRWEDQEVELPVNPYLGPGERGVLLVPKAFLRDLPTISAEEFWDYAWENHGEHLREEFGFEVKSNVSKRDIVKLAKRERFMVREYLEFREGRAQPVPYDLVEDRRGLYKWEPETAKFVLANPLAI